MKALIIGYYGSDNTGDEVLLRQTIRILRRIDRDMEIRALSYRTHRTRELHGIEAISRNRYREIVKAVRASDLIVGGGGSILQNVTSNRSLVYYLAILWLAGFLGKRTVMLGNGFGPVKGWFFPWLARRVLNGTDAFVGRDAETVDRLKAMGVQTRIAESADLAYYRYVPGESGPGRKVLINIRPWSDNDRIVGEMTKFAAYLLEKGYQLEFLSMQEERDDVLLNRISRNLSVEIPFADPSVETFLAGEPAYYAAVGMRLHGLIWAALKDVPLIALEYDPKVAAYARASGQVHGGKVEAIAFETLKEAFETLESNHEAYRQALIKSNRAMAEKAERNYVEMEKVARIVESGQEKDKRKDGEKR